MRQLSKICPGDPCSGLRALTRPPSFWTSGAMGALFAPSALSALFAPCPGPLVVRGRSATSRACDTGGRARLPYRCPGLQAQARCRRCRGGLILRVLPTGAIHAARPQPLAPRTMGRPCASGPDTPPAHIELRAPSGATQACVAPDRSHAVRAGAAARRTPVPPAQPHLMNTRKTNATVRPNAWT